MEHFYSGHIEKSRFVLTDFNCPSFNQRLGKEDYYRIIWANKKDILVEIDGCHITLKRNQLFFCTPLNTVSVEANTESISYIFSKEFYCIRNHMSKSIYKDCLFRESSIYPFIELTENQQENFNLLLVLFKKEFERIDHFQGEMLMVLLKRLLIMLNRLSNKVLPEQELPNTKSIVIGKFNYLVEKHFREKHKVSEYAELLHKSPKSLSNLFLKYSKKTPYQIISERICLEAQKLLTFTDKTISEIAYDLEFTEASHFSKFFKKQTGVPPKEYKQRNKRMNIASYLSM